MNWKKIAESRDLIILEKEVEDFKIKIEARKTDTFWEVFKTEVKGEESRLLSEYTLDTKYDVKRLIEQLKNENNPTLRTNLPTKRPINLSLKRVYKHEFIEKWEFTFGNDSLKNFMVIKFDPDVCADIVMHEKYRFHEKATLAQLEEKLGLREIGDGLNYEIYYYKKHSRKTSDASDQEYNLVDVEFDFSDEGEF